MTKTFTLKQLSETSRQEAEARTLLLGGEMHENSSEIKESSINNILAYSKSLGTTNTKLLGKQIVTLN